MGRATRPRGRSDGSRRCGHAQRFPPAHLDELARGGATSADRLTLRCQAAHARDDAAARSFNLAPGGRLRVYHARAMTRSPLELDHATMQRLGRQVADVVAEHLASLAQQRVLSNGLPARTRRKLQQLPSEEPVPFDELLAELQQDVFPYAAREPHPRFMAYVPGCPTFPAVLGDWLATGYNFFAGVWPIAEGPNAVELAVLDWFKRWIGMPAGSGGLLTNGGSGATLTAIIAARHAAVGDDASRLARLTLYASDQAHSAALRAAWIAGVPRDQVRVLPSDAGYRLRASDVQRAIADDRAA